MTDDPDNGKGIGWDSAAWAAALADDRAAQARQSGQASQRAIAADPGMDDRPFAPPDASDRDMRGPSGGASRPAKPFALVRATDLPVIEPEYIVHALLETSALALAFGDPGCGKSFLALDWAACVATGAMFHGRAVKRGLVIYIAGEGHHGLRRRLEAWQRHRGVSLDGAPLFLSRGAAQFLNPDSARAVAAAVDEIAATEGPPVLVIVDTLARNYGPGDENGTQDMGGFIAALDDLKDRYPGCSVLIVHHSGHADKGRGRGNTALRGALDAEFAVAKSAETITLTATKMKDAPEPPPISFTLQTVELGRTRAGEPITSAALTEAEAAPRPTPRMSPTLRRALETFLTAKRRAGLGDDLGAGIPREYWREVYYEMSTAPTTEARRKAFDRACQKLVEAGDLAVTHDTYRLARVPQ